MSVNPTTNPYQYPALPERADLGQLKSQAKELHQAFHADQKSACELVAKHFRVKDKREFSLARAQVVIARRYGYDSWAKLKAFVDGVNKQQLALAVNQGDVDAVDRMLKRRPEMVDCSTGRGEQRLLHLAVLNDDVPMVRLLMRRGADARMGIWPHRDSTTPIVMAEERGLSEVVDAILHAESERSSTGSEDTVEGESDGNRIAALILDGQTKEAISLLDKHPNLASHRDPSGKSFLHLACGTANVELAAWLCENGVDMTCKDSDGNTPLDLAVLSVNWRNQGILDAARSILAMLKASGVTLTPLAAAALGEQQRLRELETAKPGRMADGHQWHWLRGGVLSAAVVFDQLETVRLLLDMGINPDEPIPLGKASDDENASSWGGPLWKAAAFGRRQIAELLLERGADPNGNVYASGWPLDRAYERGDRGMIDLLCHHGAKPTAWTICAAYDLDAVQTMIRENGQDAEVLRDLVWSGACNNALSIVKLTLPLLMDAKEDLPAEKASEESWHDLLCQPMRMMGNPNDFVRPENYRYEDRFEIMRLLLESGIDPNAKGRFGLTTLHFVAARAANRGWPSLPTDDRTRFASLLLDAGADPSLRDELLCSSALGWACRYGQIELINLYRSRGVSVDDPAAPDWAQPVEWARKKGHDDIVRLLTED